MNLSTLSDEKELTVKANIIYQFELLTLEIHSRDCKIIIFKSISMHHLKKSLQCYNKLTKLFTECSLKMVKNSNLKEFARLITYYS